MSVLHGIESVIIRTDDATVDDECGSVAEAGRGLVPAGNSATEIRSNHLKCAEVFAMPKNNFLLVCCFCEDLYESMLDFGEHFCEKHRDTLVGDDTTLEMPGLKVDGYSLSKELEELEELIDGELMSSTEGIDIEMLKDGSEADDDNEDDDSEASNDFGGTSGRGKRSDCKITKMKQAESEEKPDPKLYCDQCDRQYKNHTTFARHQKNLHEKSRGKPCELTCRYCDQTFSKAEELKKHRGTHNRARPYQCPQCPKSFTSSNHRQKHINMHMGYRPYKCTECSSAFGTECNLRQHMLTHAVAGPLSCEICGKQFIHQSRKEVHMRSHTGEKPFQCELCGRKFIIRSRLTEHMKRHNNTRDHECEVCGKKFYTNVMLRHHQVAHSTDRPYICNDCGKTFPRKLSLKMHRKIHSEVKQYSCNICGREFKQYAGLYAHRKSHGEKKGLPQTNILVSDNYTPPTHLLVVKNDESPSEDSEA